MRQRKLYKFGKQIGFCLEDSDFMNYCEFMENVPAELAVQYSTHKIHFFEYVSRVVVKVSTAKEAARQFVLRFKDGILADTKDAARLVSDYIRNEELNGSDFCFLCIPASSPVGHEKRYRNFSEMVCRKTGCSNGYELIKVVSSRKEVHAGGTRTIVNYQMPSDLSGLKIILFDDVETTGMTFAKFAAELEARGAQVVQGIFLAAAASF